MSLVGGVENKPPTSAVAAAAIAWCSRLLGWATARGKKSGRRKEEKKGRKEEKERKEGKKERRKKKEREKEEGKKEDQMLSVTFLLKIFMRK